MSLPRNVSPEILDALAVHDPRAQRSRHDLQRINRIMASGRHVTRALRGVTASSTPQRLLEIGAGDGTFMLRLAKPLHDAWPSVELTLLDQHDLVATSTVAALRDMGWDVQVVVDDVMSWIVQPSAARWDVVVANLFLHHFDDCRLRTLLHAMAGRTDCLVGCEPLRERLPLLASHLVGAIGSNQVTRADAVTSVQAGFRGQELCALWPTDCGSWRLREYSAGAFSHCFVAERARN
jgi:hypothetical protein